MQCSTVAPLFVELLQLFMNVLVVIYVVKEPKDNTPRSMYAWCSLSYLGAMLSSNQALQYVNYPTQVISFPPFEDIFIDTFACRCWGNPASRSQ